MYNNGKKNFKMERIECIYISFYIYYSIKRDCIFAVRSVLVECFKNILVYLKSIYIKEK